MKEFMWLNVNGQRKLCRVLHGDPQFYTVIDVRTGQYARIPKHRVWHMAGLVTQTHTPAAA